MPQLVSPNNNVGFDQNSIPLFSWSVAGTLGDRDYYRLEVTHLRGTDWLCTKSNRAQGRSYLAEVGARAWQLSVVQTEAGALEGSACNGTVLVTSGSRTLSGNMAGSGGPDGPGPTPRRPTATPPP